MSRQGEIRAKCCVRARFSLRLSDAEASKNAKRILVAGLECGDLEARRAGEMTAWGGAKRSPRYLITYYLICYDIMRLLFHAVLCRPSSEITCLLT